MRVEGGFQGRTNKLVDSCYSFWMGGIFPLLTPWIEKQQAASMSAASDDDDADDHGGDAFVDVSDEDLYMFDRGLCPRPTLGCKLKKKSDAHPEALQRYILHCCEMPGGGFRDKPGKYVVSTRQTLR